MAVAKSISVCSTGGELSCSVCLESFQEPKVLPCCHSFCLKCLEGTLERAKDKNKLTCPQCRTQHEVPVAGARGFQDDFTLSDLQHDKKEEEVCQQCDENNTAVAYCKTCSDYFCDSCLQAHKRLKLFQDHETIRVEEMTSIEPSIRVTTFKCALHPTEQPKLYCRTCTKLACIHCFVASHNGHEVISIDEDLKKKLKKTVLENGRQLYSSLKEFQKSLEYVKSVEADKMEESTKLKADINEKVDLMIVQLEARRAMLVKRVEDTYVQDLKELWAEKEYLETVISGMEGALYFSKRVLDCKDDTHLLILSSQVMSQTKRLSQQKWGRQRQMERIEMNCLVWKESTVIHVSKRDRMRYINEIELVGDLSTRSSQDSFRIRLTLHNVPSEVECEQEAEFQVAAAIIPQKHAQVLKDVQIEASIKIQKVYFLKTATVTVERKDSGKFWTVKFTAHHSGKCCIALRAWAQYGLQIVRDQYGSSTTVPNITVRPSQTKPSE